MPDIFEPMPLRPDRYNPLRDVKGIHFWNFYLTYISAVIHLTVMIAAMNWWCNWSKIAMFYTFQIMILHAFSWAIPDHRFRPWVHKRATWFYILAGVNTLFWFVTMLWGFIAFFTCYDGFRAFLGLSVCMF